MKIFTLRLAQFAVSALFLTFLFRYALNVCIEAGSRIGTLACSVAYFCVMFLSGWHFGAKDSTDNGIHDIGFRMHLTTYISCIVVGYVANSIGWHTESVYAMNVTALSWGLGLLVHFMVFLMERKKTIKGYAKDEIFE